MMPPPLPSRSRSFIKISAVILALAGAVWLAFYYYTIDPGSSAMAPKCMFKVLTGWDCPGCGSQRAFHAILHGDFPAAWHFNPFVFFAVPAAIYYGIVEWGRCRWPRLYAASIRPVVLIPIAVAIVGWWVLRNVL